MSRRTSGKCAAVVTRSRSRGASARPRFQSSELPPMPHSRPRRVGARSCARRTGDGTSMALSIELCVAAATMLSLALYLSRVRSSDLLDGTSAIARDPFEMYPPGLGAPGFFAMPTGTAILGGRIHVAFRDFIPPLLLPGCPHLCRAASGAGERLIFVVAELDEARRTVTVARSQSCDVDAYSASRRTFGFSLALTTFLSGDHVSLVPSNG